MKHSRTWSHQNMTFNNYRRQLAGCVFWNHMLESWFDFWCPSCSSHWVFSFSFTLSRVSIKCLTPNICHWCLCSCMCDVFTSWPFVLLTQCYWELWQCINCVNASGSSPSAKRPGHTCSSGHQWGGAWCLTFNALVEATPSTKLSKDGMPQTGSVNH